MNTSPIIVNWPSGAGGDFMLSIILLLEYETGKQKETYFPSIEINFNKWSAPSSLSRYIRVIDFQGESNYLDFSFDNFLKKDCDNIIHIHDLDNFLKNGLEIPDHVRIINIDTEFQEIYIQMLYLLKSYLGEVEDLGLRPVETSKEIKHLLINHKNFFNISYHKLFFEKDINELKKLLYAFNIDCEDDIFSKVCEVFSNYHDANIRLLHSFKSFNDITDKNFRLSYKDRNENYKFVNSLNQANKLLNIFKQIKS